MRIRFGTVVFFLLAALSTFGQQGQPTRDQTREMLRATLTRYGQSALHTDFRQSDKQPYNFVGVYNTGLKNADSMEIVISVTPSQTIGFRIFPHYNKSYINVDKSRDSAALSRQLLRFCDTNFLFWGADNTYDVFAGYTVTLESGYPEEAIHVVLTSITALDKFVGEMRPFIDGTSAAAQ